MDEYHSESAAGGAGQRDTEDDGDSAADSSEGEPRVPSRRPAARSSSAARHAAIRRLLGSHRVGSQELLQRLLASDGFSVTQATLSRDLKLLGVAKAPADGGYAYRIADTGAASSAATFSADFERSLVAIELSGNLMVIKTHSGHGSSVAEALDRLGLPELVGTVAGDNTILAVVREGVARPHLLAALGATTPALTEWLV